MRKHKSVVAILLAVMMIFTFMPTMAFAGVAVDGTWSNHYSTVTVDNVDYTTAKEFGENGVITATLSDGRYDVVPAVNPVHYIDLTGAEIYSGTTEVKSIYTDQKTFENLFSSKKLKNAKLVVKCPEDAVNYVKGKTAILGNETPSFGWTVSVDMPENYESGSLIDQTVTLVAVVESDDADGSEAKPYRDDASMIIKEVTVKGAAQGREAINFFKDEVSTKAADRLDKEGTSAYPTEVVFPYDGAAHKLVNSTVEGYTVSYAVLNKSTGKYQDVEECPSVKDATDTAKVKATISDNYPTTDTRHKADTTSYFELSVAQSTAVVTFGFDKDGNAGEYAYKDAEGFDPYKYVTVTAGDHVVTWQGIVLRRTPATDEEKAAVKANEAELLACFADFCDIEQTSTKANPSVFTLKIVDKKNLDYDALAKKYKVLGENFDYTDIEVNYDQTATVDTSVAPVVNYKDDDITFTGVTTKSYKAKKKTKKLAKTKSFQVAATAASGNAVTFTATSSNAKVSIDATGKVTVKKGLKKGAKVKLVVKAKTAAGNGYKAASAEKTYTIKIK